jgi:AcrR family transcriptional regulator
MASTKREAPGKTAVTTVEYGRHRGSRRVRLDAVTWVDAGSEILVRESIEHVRVERLAAALGVTKGSFYWHFKNREELQEAILDRWYQKATLGVRDRAEREGSTPQEKLFRLLELPFWSPQAGNAADLELAIRAWSRRSPIARKAVQKVDAMRLEYLTSLFRSMFSKDDEAVARAHLTYGFMRYISQLRDVDSDSIHSLINATHLLLTAQIGNSEQKRSMRKAAARG